MVSELVKITEKRTHKIPSCRVDKELLLDIGKVIETSKRKGEQAYYNLKAQSRDVRSQNLEEFASEPPKDVEEISIRLSKGLWSTSINVTFSLEESYMSVGHGKISVSDPDATWVHGTTDRLIACFENKRLGYRKISERGEIRFIISAALTIFLCVSFGYVIFTLFSLELETVTSAFLLVGLILGILLDFSLNRLFPYYELENRALPRRARKLILGILIGSGLLPTIILKILGL